MSQPWPKADDSLACSTMSMRLHQCTMQVANEKSERMRAEEALLMACRNALSNSSTQAASVPNSATLFRCVRQLIRIKLPGLYVPEMAVVAESTFFFAKPGVLCLKGRSQPDEPIHIHDVHSIVKSIKD